MEIYTHLPTYVAANRVYRFWWQGEPYLMKCQNQPENVEEGECFEGFSRDLIDLIAKERKFKYKIVLAPDGKRGGYDAATGKWTGIIKEVQDRVSTYLLRKMVRGRYTYVPYPL